MITIEVTLTLQTPLNIGSGAQHGTLTDRAMIKDWRGWPYVPASTLKGRLRHAVEQVAAGLELPVCLTHQDMCRRHNVCAVCEIFGSPWIPGKLRFARLTLAGPEAIVARLRKLAEREVWPRTTLRYGVAISRRRGVAEDTFLYTTELFEPGEALIFQGSLSGDLERAEVALVLAGFQAISALGRGKSGGLGWCNFVIKVTGRGMDTLASPKDIRVTLADLRANVGIEEEAAV